MTAYSKAVLTETVAHQLHDLVDPSVLQISHALVDSYPASKAIRAFMQTELGRPGAQVSASQQARIPPMSTVMRTDVALVKLDDDKFTAGQIWLLTSVESVGDFVLLSSWELESRESNETAVWRMKDAPTLHRLELVLISVARAEISPSRARTLIPFQYRGWAAASY